MLFIASRWGRPEKNYEMVKEIIKNFSHLNIHVVGLCRDRVRGVHYHGLLDYAEVIKLMGDTRTLVSTSLYDSSPNVIFEAGLLGCNVVASKNCGNWRLCNTELLVEPFCLRGFLEKISLSLKGKFNDNMNYFLQERPLDQFVNLINGTVSNGYYLSSS